MSHVGPPQEQLSPEPGGSDGRSSGAGDSHMPHRKAWGGAIGAVALILGVAFAARTLTGAGDNTYASNGVSFRYPPSWQSEADAWSGTSIRSPTFSVRLFGADRANSVSVGALRIGPFSPAVVAQDPDGLVVLFSFEDASEIVDTARPGDLNGYTAYRFVTRTFDPTRSTVEHRTTVVVRGEMAYAIDCTTNGLYQQEVEEACQEIMESFRITATAPVGPL